MEAQTLRAAVLVACLLSLGASHRTENFLVTARTKELSVEVAETAERLRRDLAIEWLGEPLPSWREPCPISVHDGPRLGAGGATSFMFDQGRPFGWTMSIQGSKERILDSVLPHEVTHTVFATHFGRPLPRWADEGACTTVEHSSEKRNQERMLVEFLTTNRGIPFNDMFAMKEYPPDVLPLYAQGFSLARFLISHGNKRQFVKYVGDGMKWNNWTKATRQHYGFKNLSELQTNWLDWVRNGYPAIDASNQLASAEPAPRKQTPPVVAVSAKTDSVRAKGGRSGVAPLQSGWYARTRDEAFAERARGRTEPSARMAAVPHQPNRGGLGRSVTRPQAPVRPTQRVIEWR